MSSLTDGSMYNIFLRRSLISSENFDQALGDIFVARVAGNFVNTDIYWERLSLPENLSTPPSRKWENSIQWYFNNSLPFGKYEFLPPKRDEKKMV